LGRTLCVSQVFVGDISFYQVTTDSP